MNSDTSALLLETRDEAAAGVAVAGETLAEEQLRHEAEEAEQAARGRAEAIVEEALARRRGELAEIERRAKAAEEKTQRRYEAERRLAAEIKRHHEFLARIGSAEGEAPVQIEAAETLMAALSDVMIALHGFEHAPLPPVARKWAMAQQMCAQMADAITTFLAPRVEDIRTQIGSGQGQPSDHPALVDGGPQLEPGQKTQLLDLLISGSDDDGLPVSEALQRANGTEP
jgi:hypothetical protein